MKLFIATGIALLLLSSCSKSKQVTDENLATEVDTVISPEVQLEGQWLIEDIGVDDMTKVRPSEETPDVDQYFLFTDSSYNIMTNCNSFSGSLTVKGDSITLGDGMMTEMACDNMATEDALRRLLPKIATLEAETDSLIRLRGSPPPNISSSASPPHL